MNFPLYSTESDLETAAFGLIVSSGQAVYLGYNWRVAAQIDWISVLNMSMQMHTSDDDDDVGALSPSPSNIPSFRPKETLTPTRNMPAGK